MTGQNKTQEADSSEVTSTSLTYFHVRTFFFFILLTLLLLFYPGNSYYVDFFSKHRDIFAAVERQRNRGNSFGDFPYVINPSIQPSLTGQSVYIIDVEHATPIYWKNENVKLFPASTTKVITALTAYDAFNLDDTLEVKRILAEGQTVDFAKGEKLTFENILYALLVYSGNDAAYVIADNFPGGYEAFIEAMNAKARQLEMTNSHFINPAGFDDSRQFTTAFDLSLAGRALLENKELAKIVSTKSITITDVDFKYTHVLNSTNELLGKIPGVGGLKTGKTDLAGENLVTFYKKNDHRFLIVIMNSEDRFKDTENLVQWIDSNIQFSSI
jgi:D-alanyl-D-alanine carboxypeptidase